MTKPFPSWVEEAACLPLAFAQVREDPLVDRWVIDQVPAPAQVAMIASGGCTAAFLAATGNTARLHLVDANAAQLALARLKLHLLSSPTALRLALLGHASMPVEQRRSQLTTRMQDVGFRQADVLGPLDLIAALGPDQAGRYERVFAALQAALAPGADELDALLRLDGPAEQARRMQPNTALGRLLDGALDDVMALPILVRLFGEEATKNPVEPFSRHFARRIRWCLAMFPAAHNPYLWQMLKGSDPAQDGAPWFATPTPARLPHITWSHQFMADALLKEPGTFDFVHLSNILDWLSPEQAGRTLKIAWQAMRPGGWTLIRQLNSTLDIPGLGPMFDWHTREANELHARDRSFFYRALHLGRKR